jgi:hypothetical protein
VTHAGANALAYWLRLVPLDRVRTYLLEGVGTGVNNLCAGAPVPDDTWCYTFDFEAFPYDSVFTLVNGGTYNPGVGYVGFTNPMRIEWTFPHEVHLTRIVWGHSSGLGGGNHNLDFFSIIGNGDLEWTGNIDLTTSLDVFPGNSATIRSIRFEGTGNNPFGADNC